MCVDKSYMSTINHIGKDRNNTMFNVRILSTGSKGNCVIIDKSIMCDAGLTKKKIQDLGYDLNCLEVLLISHKHADHTNLPFIRWAIKEGIEVHLPEDVVRMLVDEGRIEINQYIDTNVFVHNPKITYDLTVPIDFNDDGEITEDENVKISMHPQKHHDIINYAFVISKMVDDKEERLLYSTDLDTIEPTDVGPGLVALGTFDIIILEGNFDEIWLRDYINIAIGSIDPDMDASQLTDKDLDHWVRENYRQLPKQISAGLFRAVQNMRHLSKQQARLFVGTHLRKGGQYYEVHRSSMFYERPSEWK